MINRNKRASVLSLVGLVPTGLFALWLTNQTAQTYESAIVQEFEQCPISEVCGIVLQCEVNISKIKEQYLKELNSPAGIAYHIAGYPTISIGYPKGTKDEFLIHPCEPSANKYINSMDTTNVTISTQ